MRWSTKQRIAFIAAHLKAAGKINRRDIMEKFEVSGPQAAMDFRHFEKAHPGAMRYDASLKAYFPCSTVRRAEGGRDTSAAADRLMRADDEELTMIIRHDPGMIRDVAAALIYERSHSTISSTHRNGPAVKADAGQGLVASDQNADANTPAISFSSTHGNNTDNKGGCVS